MKLIHTSWGLILRLPSGAEVELHADEESNLTSITLNGIPKNGIFASRDIAFCADGSIRSDGHEIAPSPTSH